MSICPIGFQLYTSQIDYTHYIGNWYFQNLTGSTNILTQSQYFPISGQLQAGPYERGFVLNNNIITYTGPTRFFTIFASSDISDGTNKEVGLRLVKDGTEISGSNSKIVTNNSGRAQGINIQSIIQLQSGSQIWAEVANFTDTTDLVIEDLNIIIQSIN